MRPEQQDRHADAVLHSTCRHTEEQVADNSMPVRPHGEQVAAALFDPLHDFSNRNPEGEFRLGLHTHGLELATDALKVGPTFFDLFASGVGSAQLCGDAGRDV